MSASQTVDKSDVAKADVISDQERQLTEKLAVILKRPPSKRKQQRKAAQEKVSGDIFARDNSAPDKQESNAFTRNGNSQLVPPPIPEIQSVAKVGNETAQKNKAPASPEPDAQSATTSSDNHPDFESTTLVKTARRARLRHGVKQAGSWLITIAVIGFITGCVALILLGLPKALDPTARISSNSAQPINAIKVKTTKQPGIQPAAPAQ